VRSIYEMNTAAQQRKSTVSHDFQPERTAVAEVGGACAAGDPAETVGSVMGVGWARVYDPSRLVTLRREHGDAWAMRPAWPPDSRRSPRSRDGYLRIDTIRMRVRGCVARRATHTSEMVIRPDTGQLIHVSGRRGRQYAGNDERKIRRRGA
jgi:hypothetical protein